jgi:hypothetical protein
MWLWAMSITQADELDLDQLDQLDGIEAANAHVPDPTGWEVRYQRHQRCARRAIWLTPAGLAVGSLGAALFWSEQRQRCPAGWECGHGTGPAAIAGVGLLFAGAGAIAMTPIVTGYQAGAAQKELALGGAEIERWQADAALGVSLGQPLLGPVGWGVAMALGYGQLRDNELAFERLDLAASAGPYRP